MQESFAARGGWWVVAQFIMLPAMLVAMVLARRSGLESPWPTTAQYGGVILGAVLLITAAALLITAVLRLGSNLTPFPQPLKESTLIVNGAYAIVRHPIYTSLILAVAGVAFFVGSVLGMVFVVVTLIFFDRKAGFEERMLLARHPDYAAYRLRVKKLIPFVY
jgi:protein-S-isoprenylcysteine O-methyltransferase Ste14